MCEYVHVYENRIATRSRCYPGVQPLQYTLAGRSALRLQPCCSVATAALSVCASAAPTINGRRPRAARSLPLPPSFFVVLSSLVSSPRAPSAASQFARLLFLLLLSPLFLRLLSVSSRKTEHFSRNAELRNISVFRCVLRGKGGGGARTVYTRKKKNYL